MGLEAMNTPLLMLLLGLPSKTNFLTSFRNASLIIGKKVICSRESTLRVLSSAMISPSVSTYLLRSTFPVGSSTERWETKKAMRSWGGLMLLFLSYLSKVTFPPEPSRIRLDDGQPQAGVAVAGVGLIGSKKRSKISTLAARRQGAGRHGRLRGLLPGRPPWSDKVPCWKGRHL